MTVGVVGSGPAVDAIEASLADVDVQAVTGDVDIVVEADLAVVVGLAGSTGFQRANELALESGTPWIAVEIGGIGGTAVSTIDATVSALDPAVVCFECLRSRVQSVGVESAAEPSADRSAVRVAGAYAGQLAIRAISGDDIAGTVIEVPYAQRNLLAVPNCDCSTDRDLSFERSVVTRSLDESVSIAERAIDDRLGIVPQIGEHGSFPAPYYLATIAETTGFSDGDAPGRAAGVDADWDRAFMKALGEALERYSAAIYQTAAFTSKPVEDTNGVSPAQFVRPSGLPDPEPTASIEWVAGVDLHTDESVELPAEFVHFPPPAETYTTAITTGLGLGNDVVEATLSGLYEIVERDATMIGWYSTFEPLGLTVDDERYAALEKRAAAEGLTVTPLLMTQDVDTPVVSVAVHRDEWPSFAVGSAADLDGTAAARGALAEAIQNWMELRNMGPDQAANAEGAIARYADYPREVRAFTETSGRVDADSVGVDASVSGTDELETLLERVGQADLDAFAARITPRDVQSIGFEAVRVLVPTAQPLFVSAPFFGERAKTVPRKLGYEPRLDRPFHPYP